MHITVILLGCLGMTFGKDIRSVLESYGLIGQPNALSFDIFEHAFKATVKSIEFRGFSNNNDALLTLDLTGFDTSTVWNVALLVHYNARLMALQHAEYPKYEHPDVPNIEKMFSDGMAISAPEGLLKALTTPERQEIYYLRYQIGRAVLGAISTHKILPMLEAKGLLNKDKGVIMNTIKGKVPSATINEFHTNGHPIDCVSIKAQLFNAAGTSYRANAPVHILVHLTAGGTLELATPPSTADKTELFAFADGVPFIVEGSSDETVKNFFNFYLGPTPEAKKGIFSRNEPKTSTLTEQRQKLANAFVAALNDAKP